MSFKHKEPLGQPPASSTREQPAAVLSALTKPSHGALPQRWAARGHPRPSLPHSPSPRAGG